MSVPQIAPTEGGRGTQALPAHGTCTLCKRLVEDEPLSKLRHLAFACPAASEDVRAAAKRQEGVVPPPSQAQGTCSDKLKLRQRGARAVRS